MTWKGLLFGIYLGVGVWIAYGAGRYNKLVYDREWAWGAWIVATVLMCAGFGAIAIGLYPLKVVLFVPIPLCQLKVYQIMMRKFRINHGRDPIDTLDSRADESDRAFMRNCAYLGTLTPIMIAAFCAIFLFRISG